MANSIVVANAEWKEFAGLVLRKGYSIIDGPASSEIDGRTQTLAFSLLARSLSNFSAANTLIDIQKIVEARILVRSCIENEFFIGALSDDPKKFFRQLEADDVKHRQMRGEQYFADPRNIDEQVASRLKNWLKSSKKRHPDPKTINPKKIAGMNPTYIIYGQLSSDAGHASLTSLQRYVIRQDGVPHFSPHAILDPREIVDTYRWGCLSLIRSCGKVNELLGRAENDGIQQIVEKFSQLLKIQNTELNPSS